MTADADPTGPTGMVLRLRTTRTAEEGTPPPAEMARDGVGEAASRPDPGETKVAAEVRITRDDLVPGSAKTTRTKGASRAAAAKAKELGRGRVPEGPKAAVVLGVAVALEAAGVLGVAEVVPDPVAIRIDPVRAATPVVTDRGPTAAEIKGVGTKVVETKVVETTAAETKVVGTKAAETKVVETRVVETRVVETRVVETTAADVAVGMAAEEAPVAATNLTEGVTAKGVVPVAEEEVTLGEDQDPRTPTTRTVGARQGLRVGAKTVAMGGPVRSLVRKS